MSKPKDTNVPFDFEKTLAELNTLVEQMEKGGLKLEDSLEHYERGIALARACQEALKNAEQKVQILLEQNGQTTLVAFDNSAE